MSRVLRTWPSEIHRVSRRVALGCVILLVVAFLISLGTAHEASAQLTPGFDPAGGVKSFVTSNGWLTKAQTWARHIFVALIVFEFFALGVATLLFRDNLGEFYASLCLKVVLGSVFFWFISVAGPSLGQLPGAVVFGTFGDTFGKGLGGTDDVAGIATKGAVASGAFFSASYSMRVADGVAASIKETTGTIVPLLPNPVNCTEAYTDFSGGGTCYEQPARTVAFGRQAAENITAGLGLMVGTAVAAMYLQYTMITIEAYFVMTAGVLFIGFAGSRFTASFSQGYFSYMISVGVKLMTFYIVLGLIGPLVLTILGSSIVALASSIAGSLVPGLGAASTFVTLASALFASLSAVILAGLVYAVPGLAASFLTGQSSVSGAAVASQAMRSMAGGAQMMGQLAAAGQARKDMVAEEKSAHEGATHQHPSGSTSSAANKQHDSFAAQGTADKHSSAAEHAAPSAGSNVLADTLGMSHHSGGGSPPAPTAAEKDLAQSNVFMANAASAVASAAPQDTGQPAAVSVRVGTPDRL